jgi:plastocyanin
MLPWFWNHSRVSPFTFLLIGLLALGRGAGIRPGADLRGTAKLGDKAIAEAVVWLDAPKAPRVPRGRVILDQRNLTFYPRVLAVQTGTTVDFPNNDRVYHDVFSFRDSGKFNLGLYPVGVVKRVPFDKPGLSRIFCNIHPHMAAYVMVVDTPYFAVSGQDGSFAIRDVPEGAYTFHAWRPGGEILNGTTTVRPGGTLDVRWP